MTFTQIKTRIKNFCNLTSSEADTRIGIAINEHYRRITASLGIDPVRFVTRSAVTTIGVQTVTFTDIEFLTRVIDTTDATAIRRLTQVSLEELRATQPGSGQPATWALNSTTADDVVIRLDTVPQAVYSLQADGSTTLGDLSGSDEPVFSESFHDILSFVVIAEELLKKEKIALAREFASGNEERPGRAEHAIKELRFKIAEQGIPDAFRQGRLAATSTSTSASGGGGGNQGGASYTQSGLITFDRGAGLVPFAVTQADAPYVPNLGAEFLGNITTDRLIGRDTAGTGETEQLTVGGGIAFTGSGGIQTSAFTGDVTKAAGGTALTIANDAVTFAKMQNITSDRLIGRDTASAGDPEEIAVTNGLTFTGSASIGIANDGVTYARMQDVSAASRVLGRGSASGSGDPEELTCGAGLTIATTTISAIAGSARCVAYHNTTQSISASTPAALSLNAEDVDVGSLHNTVTNNSRVTIPSGADGFYIAMGLSSAVQGSSGTDGTLELSIRKNGTTNLATFVGANPGLANEDYGLTVFWAGALAAADYLEFVRRSRWARLYGRIKQPRVWHDLLRLEGGLMSLYGKVIKLLVDRGYPLAPDSAFAFRGDGTFLRWDDAYGPQPTQAQIDAVTDTQAADAEAARIARGEKNDPRVLALLAFVLSTTDPSWGTYTIAQKRAAVIDARDQWETLRLFIAKRL